MSIDEPADNPNRASQNPDGSEPLSTPYGPHYRGTDLAAGGADSSPFENESREDQHAAADAERAMARDGRSDPAGLPRDTPTRG